MAEAACESQSERPPREPAPGPGADDAAAAPLRDALAAQPARVAADALRLAEAANVRSQRLCELVLENAAASDLVKDGQELLAVSRQMAPLLERLKHAAAAARQLCAAAEAAAAGGEGAGAGGGAADRVRSSGGAAGG
ncbi:hypothetical protein Rsub_05436 [Raphidocelis subcapitata]|uniref:Uncharacterized protein n=1 Tax=Raphidocelis subcapitata TaxID=307507 RepID=A0A2V0P6K3_9CHLO|nr:hypothetical protein Rsub_05436 [Raphidocelis subcapitata]|eukprot:GBF92817.1 hypothetical protein Rsub_05436 [Raphidocelis subcapitata]